MNKITQTFEVGNRKVTLETGEIGRQAHATVICNMDDTVVLAAATNSSRPTTQNFLPMAVDYQEKAYAAGKFPGGFFKREGRPSEKEVLTCRLIDRSIRPLFPSLYRNEINVNCSVLSYNPEVDGDIPAMIASFAAVRLSGMPVAATLGAVRVGLDSAGKPLVCPTIEETAASKLELLMAGSEEGILMVESSAQQLSEDTMIDALEAGHDAIKKIVAAVEEFHKKSGKQPQEWTEPVLDADIKAKLTDKATPQIKEAYGILDKQERSTRLSEIRATLREELLGDEPEVSTQNLFDIAVKKLESSVVREGMLKGGKRIDGRDATTVRDITIRTGVLPRTHGSALFTRGETQALVVCTLGTGRDEQKIDSLGGESYDRFLMHYNMPPYATGETGRMMSPKRREIGHGRLAKRALLPALPDLDEFGYSIRLVSEITESNGSSSMASVCGGSLAMMDAGVPVGTPVAGIAMGLIHGDDNDVILSDILGDEDHLGDMDFKVAGTAAGINALQMDIKINGVDRDLLARALAQAKDARLHILEKMNAELAKPRETVSDFAPSIMKIKIKVEKIRDVIGKSGSTINKLTEETGTNIDIDDDGTITVSGPTAEHCRNACKKIEGITSELELGQIYEGKVTKILDFGAIVSMPSGNDGLLHISRIANEHVENVRDRLKEGQEVRVKVVQSDRGKVRLSMRASDLES
ncbi:MAG: polyribonucleotide nucleotidyltransferase [Betaproteobacteria bacterium AqS2]|uniref:Polyribonucleotide nucleotidyltransferase n=1 Tax=Candidatus Amphirhobacter heronislandensis TaxID=1732024 RepID=A0A930UBG7_9GAMM|nr:polyribonucleotide nucleotidyltransferase [Betaproteobacteria bacterium AqS2]